MEADSPIAQRWELMRERLDERQRRAFAAAEAKVIGRGGVSQVVAATGLARNTVMAGMQELEGSSNEFITGTPLAIAGSTRRSGGGRKAATHKDPSLVPDLLALADPTSRGIALILIGAVYFHLTYTPISKSLLAVAMLAISVYVGWQRHAQRAGKT